MADDQRERLRNGTFGAIAGTSIGGLGALLSKNQNLLFVGVLGSAGGAALAWVVYVVLAIVASHPGGRRMVEYHIRGLKGVTDQIVADDKLRLLAALDDWFDNFGRMLNAQRDAVLLQRNADNVNRLIEMAIDVWIRVATDTFNLVLDALAEKTEYRSRITVIVFGQNGQHQPEGRHWKSYAGALTPHRDLPFSENSVAYKVLAKAEVSPYFTTSESADTKAQDRHSSPYHSFMVLRINDYSVISLDWPGDLKETDPYIEVLRRVFLLDVVPAMAALLGCWRGDAAQALGMRALSGPAPPKPALVTQ
jgi:hypothetical protein